MIRICQKNIKTFIFSKKREENLFLKKYVVVSFQKLGSRFTFINIFTLNKQTLFHVNSFSSILWFCDYVSHHKINFEFISTTEMIQSEIITSERKWLSWIDYVIYNIVKRSGWDRFYKHLINMKWGVRQ